MSKVSIFHNSLSINTSEGGENGGLSVGTKSVGEPTVSDLFNDRISTYVVPIDKSSGDSISFYTGMLKNVKKVVIPEGTKVISPDTIPAAEEIIIPEGVTVAYIGSQRETTKKVKHIDLPSTITKFTVGGTGIEEIEIPSSVTEICQYAFQGCTKLKSLTIPSSVTKIAGRAFLGCYSLSKLVIPETVTTIENYALAESSSTAYALWEGEPIGFTEIEFKNGAALNGKTNIFQKNKHLKKITIGPGLTKIPDYFCDGCNELEEINFSDQDIITSIGTRAFSACGFKRFVFPNGCKTVTETSFALFSQPQRLEYVYMPNTMTSIHVRTFKGFDNITIDCGFAEGAVSGAPWGATNATINYNVATPQAPSES